MLAALRTTRRILGGALALLVLSSWLSVAVAACLEHGPANGPDAHAEMVGMEMSHDCPHCDTVGVDAACADDPSDCELPPVLLPSSQDDLKFTAVAPHPAEPEVARMNAAVSQLAGHDPPVSNGRDRHILFCSFQE